MRLRSAAPTFLVDDVGSTAEWYARELGFAFETFPQAPPFAYASLQRDGAEIMLLRQEGYRKPEVVRATGAWDAYIRLDGVNELWERVRAKSWIAKPLANQPYGDTEFEVRDPNGYVLVFGGSWADRRQANGSTTRQPGKALVLNRNDPKGLRPGLRRARRTIGIFSP